MHRSELGFGLLRIPSDLLAIFAAFGAALFLRAQPGFLPSLQGPAATLPELAVFIQFAGMAALAFIPVAALAGLYSFRRLGRGAEFSRVFFAVAALWLLISAYFFFAREFFFSRLAFLYAAVLGIVFVLIGRWILRGLQALTWRYGHGRVRLAIIGSGEMAAELAAALRRERRFQLVGYFGAVSNSLKIKQLGLLADFESVAAQKMIDAVIVADPELDPTRQRELLAFARTHHLEFAFVPHLLDASPKNIDINSFRGVPVVTLLPSPLTGWGRIAKRIFDLVVGSLAIVLTSPIWLATAIAIRLDSPGPIFFGRYPDGKPVLRVGRHGRLFQFTKFRSMVVNDHYSRYSMPSHRAGPLVKIAHDPRITRVGHLIRRTSIDELPNLIAVIKGDMSLTGPRAHLPEEVEKYTPEQLRVLEIKPGITGLPQVSGRSDLSFEREVELDIWYIENWSLWLDIKILFQTVGVVLFPKHKE